MMWSASAPCMFIVLIACSSFADSPSTYGPPNASRISKLVAEAWRPLPEHVEVEYMATYLVPPREATQKRETLRQLYSHLVQSGSAGDLTPTGVSLDALIDSRVENHIARDQANANEPRQMRALARKSGPNDRWDYVFSVTSGEKITSATPFRDGEVNLFDPHSGQRTNIKISHGTKTAIVRSDTRSRVEPVWEYGGLSPGITFLLQLMTAPRMENEEDLKKALQAPDRIGPSAERLIALQSGSDPDFRLGVRSTSMDGLDCDEWEAWCLKASRVFPAFVIAFKTDDYSIIPRTEVFDPNSGLCMSKIEATSFRTENSVTFPSAVRVEKMMRVNRDGSPLGVYSAENYRHVNNIVILAKAYPAEMPTNLFSVAVPPEYRLTDYRHMQAPEKFRSASRGTPNTPPYLLWLLSGGVLALVTVGARRMHRSHRARARSST